MKIDHDTVKKLFAELDEHETSSVSRFQRQCCDNCDLPGRMSIEQLIVKIRASIRKYASPDPTVVPLDSFESLRNRQ